MEWVEWCEETAKSTAVEVASVIRSTYPDVVCRADIAAAASASSTTAVVPPDGQSQEEANDLIRRFVQVFALTLESHILRGEVVLQNGHSEVNHSHQRSLTNSDQSQSREGDEVMSDLEPSTPSASLSQPVKKPFYRRLFIVLSLFRLYGP